MTRTVPRARVPPVEGTDLSPLSSSRCGVLGKCRLVSHAPDGASSTPASTKPTRQGDGLWPLIGTRSRVTCAGSRRLSPFLGGSLRMLLVACRRRRLTTAPGGAEIGHTPAPGRPSGSRSCVRSPGVSVTFRRVGASHRLRPSMFASGVIVRSPRLRNSSGLPLRLAG